MNKTTIAIVIVAVVVAGGFFFLHRGTSTPPTSGAPGSPTGGNVQVESATVVYGASGFSPATLRVKAGATVTFKNESSNQMWVASNPHPVHTGYSGFDARQAYGSGQSYSFTFARVGTWSYHNHLNPGDGGTIVVE